jgi:hypothetical protein
LRWRRCGIGLIRDRCSDDRWRGGRPRIDAEIRELIAIMAKENGLWGAPRVHGELLKQGFKVSQATVSRYLRRCPRPRSQGWRTFLRSHFVLTAPRAASEGTVDHRSSPVAHGPATLSLPPSRCAAAPGRSKAPRSLRDSARPAVGGLPASNGYVRVRLRAPTLRPHQAIRSGIAYRLALHGNVASLIRGPPMCAPARRRISEQRCPSHAGYRRSGRLFEQARSPVVTQVDQVLRKDKGFPRT